MLSGLTRWTAVFAGALLSVATSLAQATNPRLEARFLHPPDDARPMVRWWWFGPAVTKPELAREMQQMKAAGFGGFEIQPVYPLALDDPATGFRNLPYLSAAFLDDLRFVNTTAHRLGLRVNLTLASGWPYGGPRTPVTEAAAQVRLVRAPVAPGAQSVAVPALSHGESLLSVFLVRQDASGRESVPLMLPLPQPGAVRMPLGATVSRSGAQVLWFLSSRTGQQVKRAAVGAEGFVLDPFSRQAVQDHLHSVADTLMTAFGNRPPYSVFSDSLEVYGADWTPDLLQQFRKRRGYDLLPHLPELFSSDLTPEALAVRHDWGQTLTELIDENYLEAVNTWASNHRTLFRSQSYGSPAVSLSSNAHVALPEGEGPQWQQFSYTRWATSASHLYGVPITSSETWTWLHSPPFRATPLDMKAEADRFFLQGINQIVGHGWPYSPPSAGEPGWRFYAAGAFNAHNPWWIVMPDVNRYLTRVSWMLRQGEAANDVAVYLPEDDAYAAFTPGEVSLTDLLPRSITPELTAAIETAGYNFDYIDAQAIERRGIHYSVLILPDVDRMSLATLEQIAEYRKRGGQVIALERLPAHAPGLLLRQRDSPKVETEAKQLFAPSVSGTAYVHDAGGLAAVLHRMLAPDLSFATHVPKLGFIHRKLAGADVYFLANTGNTPVRTTVEFRTQRAYGEWLDADTGRTRAIKSTRAIPLELAPYASSILMLEDKPPPTEPAASEAGGMEAVVEDLSTGWKVHFDESGVDENMPHLHSWTTDPSNLYYSGTATYRTFIHLDEKTRPGGRYILDFGTGEPVPEENLSPDHPGMQAWYDPPIREAAVVYLNGQSAGSLWHPPYMLDVTALLKAGQNELKVKVANTAINELAGRVLPDYRLLWARYGKRFAPQDMEHLQPVLSGLLGEPRLLSKSAP